MLVWGLVALLMRLLSYSTIKVEPAPLTFILRHLISHSTNISSPARHYPDSLIYVLSEPAEKQHEYKFDASEVTEEEDKTAERVWKHDEPGQPQFSDFEIGKFDLFQVILPPVFLFSLC